MQTRTLCVPRRGASRLRSHAERGNEESRSPWQPRIVSMSQPLLERQRAALQTLTQLAAGRARAEKERDDLLRSRTEKAAAELEASRQQIAARFEADRTAAEQELQQTRQESVA